MIELIKFGANWCGPCRVVAPTVKKLAEKYNTEESEIQVTDIDIDANPAFAQEYKVMSIPTFVFKKNGEIEHRQTGVMTEEQIESQIRKLNEN